MVLLVVVVVVVMLSLAGLSFVSLLYTEHKAVHLSGDEIQADHLVGSGEELLKVFLEMPYEEQEEAGGWYDNPDRFRGVIVLGNERSGPRGRFCIVSPRIENGDRSGVRFGLENESARLNLGVLPQWEHERPGAGREALMRLPGMTESVADGLLDWVDADANQRDYGAEEDYYMGLQAPYAPRNAPPTSLEELLLVRGVTRDLLLGPSGLNSQESEQEGPDRPSPLSFAGAGEPIPWASLLTVAGAERNTTPEGNPRADLNESDLTGLHQKLSLVLPADWTRFIIAYRQYGPFKGPAESGGDAGFQLDLSVPGRFRLRSVLDLVDARVRIPRPGQEKPIVLSSPLANDPASLRESLPKLLDQVTVVRSPVIRGRVNLDLAPREVLSAVPGIDDALADRIVASRGSQPSQEDPARRHGVWLLADGLVDLEQMRELSLYVTGGGDVYRAQIVGFFDRPAPCARVELVIDATVRPPRQVYWKDLRMLGPGYPLETLGGEPPADAKPLSVWDRDRESP
ncbi:MAG: general secretion pathway protein GspK [Pirellulales bacterium]|nr:general secretion pathway protein GspK [Pirellulales bacterium]